mgnify:CR=1 FL=1
MNHDHSHDHSHSHDHGHDHEVLEHPGHFAERALPLSDRDFRKRAFTVGVGGPVGTGKSALVLALCQALREEMNLAVVTNDIFTREDAEFLIRNEALAAERIQAVETGGCPHAAIREDITMNLAAVEELSREFEPDMLLLDEPTNHLDLEATIWLESFLAEWKGGMVMISHDREFLDRSINLSLIHI